MTTAARIEIIAEVVAQHDALAAAFAPIIAAFRNHDFPAFEQAWQVFGLYLAAKSREMGDADCWLYWFVFENKCGRDGMSARAAAWSEMRPILTPADLASVIEADLPAPLTQPSV